MHASLLARVIKSTMPGFRKTVVEDVIGAVGIIVVIGQGFLLGESGWKAADEAIYIVLGVFGVHWSRAIIEVWKVRVFNVIIPFTASFYLNKKGKDGSDSLDHVQLFAVTQKMKIPSLGPGESFPVYLVNESEHWLVVPPP